MNLTGWILSAVLAAAIIVMLIFMRMASRLERLDQGIAFAGGVLERHLQGRARAAVALSRLPGVDPATAFVLFELAEHVLEDAPPVLPTLAAGPRAEAEGDLTAGLRSLLPELKEELADDPIAHETISMAISHWRSAEIATTMLNTRVMQENQLRAGFVGSRLRVTIEPHVQFVWDSEIPFAISQLTDKGAAADPE